MGARLSCFKSWLVVVALGGLAVFGTEINKSIVQAIFGLVTVLFCIAAITKFREKSHYRISSYVCCIDATIGIIITIVVLAAAAGAVASRYQGRYEGRVEEQAQDAVGIAIVIGILATLLCSGCKCAVAWYAKKVADYLENEGTKFEDLEVNSAKAREIGDEEDLGIDYARIV